MSPPGSSGPIASGIAGARVRRLSRIELPLLGEGVVAGRGFELLEPLAHQVSGGSRVRACARARLRASRMLLHPELEPSAAAKLLPYACEVFRHVAAEAAVRYDARADTCPRQK